MHKGFLPKSIMIYPSIEILQAMHKPPPTEWYLKVTFFARRVYPVQRRTAQTQHPNDVVIHTSIIKSRTMFL